MRASFFTLAQPTTGMKGALANHVVILRVDLTSRTASVFCTLPNAGSVGKGIPGYGLDPHFGPAEGSFANTFYSATTLNDMIYQTRADGSCKPFVNTSRFGAPAALTFARAKRCSSRPHPMCSGRRVDLLNLKGAIVRSPPRGRSTLTNCYQLGRLRRNCDSSTGLRQICGSDFRDRRC
jgi:hypothetical protein